MAKESRKSLLPTWGYVVLNLVFLAVMVVLYQSSESYARSHQFYTAGLLPVLAICYISFTVVSIFDAVFDRAALRQSERPRPTDAAPASQVGDRPRKD